MIIVLYNFGNLLNLPESSILSLPGDVTEKPSMVTMRSHSPLLSILGLDVTQILKTILRYPPTGIMIVVYHRPTNTISSPIRCFNNRFIHNGPSLGLSIKPASDIHTISPDLSNTTLQSLQREEVSTVTLKMFAAKKRQKSVEGIYTIRPKTLITTLGQSRALLFLMLNALVSSCNCQWDYQIQRPAVNVEPTIFPSYTQLKWIVGALLFVVVILILIIIFLLREVAQLKKQLKEQDTTIATIKAELASKDKRLKEQDATIATIKAELALKDEEIKGLKVDITNLKATVDLRDEEIKGLKVDITNLKATVDLRDEEIKGLKGDITNLKATVDLRDNEIKGLKADVKRLNADVQSFRYENSKIRGNLGKANASITRLAAEIKFEKNERLRYQNTVKKERAEKVKVKSLLTMLFHIYETLESDTRQYNEIRNDAVQMREITTKGELLKLVGGIFAEQAFERNPVAAAKRKTNENGCPIRGANTVRTEINRAPIFEVRNEDEYIVNDTKRAGFRSVTKYADFMNERIEPRNIQNHTISKEISQMILDEIFTGLSDYLTENNAHPRTKLELEECFPKKIDDVLKFRSTLESDATRNKKVKVPTVNETTTFFQSPTRSEWIGRAGQTNEARNVMNNITNQQGMETPDYRIQRKKGNKANFTF